MGAGVVRADELVQRLAQDARRSIEQAAAVARPADSAVEGSPSEVVATLALPAAQLSLAVANMVSKGAKALSQRVAGEAEAGAVAVAEQATAPAPRARRSARA